MSPEIIIERWFAIGWLIFGVSHVLYPATWTALFQPARERETSRLWMGAFNLLLGLLIAFGHNIWTWDLSVIVTLTGWLMSVKGAIYLLLPRAVAFVLPSPERMQRGFRIAGAVMIFLGAFLAYQAFS